MPTLGRRRGTPANYWHTVSARVTEAAYVALDAEAIELDISLAELIRRIVDKHIEAGV